MSMEMKFSLDNTRNTTIADSSHSAKLTSNMREIRRLSTFASMGGDIHLSIPKGRLARMGFKLNKATNTIICEDCDFTSELSICEDDLIEKHLQHNPQCSFILNFAELHSRMDQSNSLDASINFKPDTLVSNHQIGLNSVFNTNDNTDNSQKAFLHSLSDTTLTKLRTNTFSNWPLITPNVHDMITAGFYYTNIADRVICPHCDILFHKWTETDRPYQIHQLKSPKCPFILTAEKNGTSLQTTPITITSQPSTQITVNTVDSPFALAHRRRETFQSWPSTTKDSLPSIDSFVDAGFHYTGDRTIVQCFYCNGALRDWQSGDDPKVEHARWFPHCAYIRQYIGEDLYQAIQRKNQELKAQQNATNQNLSSYIWSHDEIDRMVKARLDLPFVEKLRQAGFTMAIIRKTFEMQLKFKKDDFKSDNDLQLACLILDLQVKIVNGNEGNLLIPQEWLKKYIEDQAKPKPQIQSQLPPQTTTQTVVELPKVTPPAIPQPKTKQPPSDDDTALCVLCLTTERQVACLPCGHLTSCVACGHSLKTCPICRAPVKAFVRIYV